VEREVLLTGIGGQGIQLAAQVLARAALAEGREVQLFGSYGGMMRGGNTEATLVVADAPVEAPPTVDHAWSAVVMHHDFSEPTLARVGPGSVVFLNTTIVDPDLGRGDVEVVGVPVSDLAVDLGNVMTASMVMLGVYVTVTGLVTLDGAVEAVAASLPSYRSKHVELNARAIRAGADAAPPTRTAAWTDKAAVGA
jgi:Pyruvate/2-oxoacid:ferredoxin oxidoreductase gamma subunit